MEIDPSETDKLLVSTTPQVLVGAINVLAGQPLDAKRFALLKSCLANKSNLVSWRAADVLAKGSSGEQAVEAVKAIGGAISASAAAQMPTLHFRGEVAVFSWKWIVHPILKVWLLQRWITRFFWTLLRMSGKAREAMIIALGRRKDVSTHAELEMMARDAGAGLFRAWAVRALTEIGGQEDLPLLRQLAKDDPLVRQGFLRKPKGIGEKGPTFPVREAAEDAIRVIETRLQKERKQEKSDSKSGTHK